MYQIKIIECGHVNDRLMDLEIVINKWFAANPDIKLIKIKRTGLIATIVYKIKKPKSVNLTKD